MKRIILTLSIILFSFSTLFAQTLYTRTDTLAITTDSVTLQAGTFRGAIQWQRSADGQTWENLSGKTGKTLNVYKTNEGFYRAAITEGTCNATYSDTAVIVANKPASNLITDPDNIAGATFIERDGGTFTFVGSSANIPVNTVFVDSDKESDIRVVTGLTKNGDTLSVSTKLGAMEDLFFNQEFKLSTEMLNNTNKSAYLTTEAMAKAMKDGNGVIHPVKVIDNNAPANNLKSVQSTNESLPGVYFRNDFSGDTIWNEGGALISFDQAYYQLGAELNYEFKFEQQGFDWQNLKFPKGKLTKFKICTNKEASGIESKMIIKATTSKEFKKNSTKIIKKDAFNKTFQYLVVVPPLPVPIPFWATVKVDLMRSDSASISGEASVSGGATGNFNLELGASYENGAWTTIKPSLTPELTLDGPDVDAKVNVQAKIEVYPHVEVAFYSALSPYLDIAPYVRQEMEYSIQGNFKYDLYTGVNARLGIKSEVLGEKLFDYKTGDLNLYEKSLYTAPKKVQVVSGANQKATAGKPLPQPIVIKVLDSKDKPVKNAVVNFKASLGKLFKALLSSPENASLKSAMLYASATDSTQLAVASDTTGQVTINWTLADSTAKHQLETYLMSGKDSIREDTRDTITAEACDCNDIFINITDPRDGQVYKTIQVGNQTWMAEDLRYAPRIDPLSSFSSCEPRYYFDNTSYNGYNRIFYNATAALSSCPSGWHLPSVEEWDELINFLGGPSVAKLKMLDCQFENNIRGKNSSCFSYRDGGGVCFTGHVYNSEADCSEYQGSGALNCNHALYWSSTKYINKYTKGYCVLNPPNPFATGSWKLTHFDFYDREYGSIVRCIKD